METRKRDRRNGQTAKEVNMYRVTCAERWPCTWTDMRKPMKAYLGYNTKGKCKILPKMGRTVHKPSLRTVGRATPHNDQQQTTPVGKLENPGERLSSPSSSLYIHYCPLRGRL